MCEHGTVDKPSSCASAKSLLDLNGRSTYKGSFYPYRIGSTWQSAHPKSESLSSYVWNLNDSKPIIDLAQSRTGHDFGTKGSTRTLNIPVYTIGDS